MSAEVRANAELAAAVDQARPTVEGVIGASSAQVAARWTVARNPDGRPTLVLNLSDLTRPNGVETRFGLEDSASEIRWKVLRLWGDLLQARSHQQLAELLQTEA